jgi:hypothetical protein
MLDNQLSLAQPSSLKSQGNIEAQKSWYFAIAPRSVFVYAAGIANI